MNITKIIGWVTFLAGVSIILFTLYSSYNIFTGKMDVPQIFEIEEKAVTTGIKTGTPKTPEDISGAMMEQLKAIFPTDTISKFLNLSIWMMLAGILIFGGTQVAGLGIKLIKIYPQRNLVDSTNQEPRR